MRIVTGTAKPTSCDALRFWLGIESVKERQIVLAAQAFLKALTTSTHPLHTHIVTHEDELVEQRLKTVRSWVKDARDAVEEICPQENIKDIEWVDMIDMPVKTDRIGNRSWRDRAETINRAEVCEWLTLQNPTVVIATDGSIRNGTTAWAGAIWREGNVCYEWSTARRGRSSSFRAEGEALEDALVWTAANTDQRDVVVILTDSLSVLTKMA